MKRLMQIALLFTVAFTIATPVLANEKTDRQKAQKLYKDGNFNEAYQAYSKLALNAKTDPKTVGSDMNMAISSIQRLNRRNEIDVFREKVIKVHAKNWRLLLTAAQSYQGANHSGYIVSGEFRRGRHRGGGQYANSYERDRVRALQLMVQAIPLTKNDGEHTAVGSFYQILANMMMGNRGYAGAWRLQYKTDIDKLPDYQKGILLRTLRLPRRVARGSGRQRRKTGIPLAPQDLGRGENRRAAMAMGAPAGRRILAVAERVDRLPVRIIPQGPVRRRDHGQIRAILRLVAQERAA